MQIWNQMGYLHQFTMGMDKAGHEWIVVVVKGTFDFPEKPGGLAQKSAEQVPFVMADTQTGAPGYSAAAPTRPEDARLSAYPSASRSATGRNCSKSSAIVNGAPSDRCS